MAYKRMHLAAKVVYTFNKFYGNFLRDAKNDESIKRVIKENYKVILKTSPEYLEFFWNGLKEHASNIDASNKLLLDVNIFKGVKLSDVIAKLGEKNVVTIWNYIFILSALCMVYDNIADKTTPVSHQEDEQSSIEVSDLTEVTEVNEATEVTEATTENEVMFEKIIKVFGMVQRGEDASCELSDILDDDIRNVLTKISKPVDLSDVPEEKDDLMNMFASIENSKICNLAKEISSEIDVSNLKIESPQDVMKLMDFSGSNNVLGNIIGKVSSKIQEKISTGEIKHEDLLGEAMSMMSLMNKGGGAGGLGGLFNNPMMSEMMKNMKKGKVATKTDVLKRGSTRDKLRRKLEERRKEKDSA